MSSCHIRSMAHKSRRSNLSDGLFFLVDKNGYFQVQEKNISYTYLIWNYREISVDNLLLSRKISSTIIHCHKFNPQGQ